MQVPKLLKIVLSRGVGSAVADKNLLIMQLKNYQLLLVKKQ
ncbi:MAG: hypothetical protein CM15mP122_3590 [Bacteroidota bacterium]|nr:MAG: hypothetical protein CM15mP122_3590 [Bacteroidota bacterium]